MSNEKVLEIRKLTTFADNAEDFKTMISDHSEWIITKDNRLLDYAYIENASESELNGIQEVDSFLLPSPSCVSATHHTTDWLRAFCNEHHQEVDFDAEFQTDEPGVFARYQEKFGHDYEDWVSDSRYEALMGELAKRGYRLAWD